MSPSPMIGVSGGMASRLAADARSVKCVGGSPARDAVGLSRVPSRAIIPPLMDIAIRCRDLRKVYEGKPPVEALRGLDLEVRSGECFGILGPNGAGKTTTVEILEGILQASGGDVEVLGMRWGPTDRALRERIGVSLQETRLADKLTVEETLDLFGSFYERGRSALEVMAEVRSEERRVGKECRSRWSP